MPTEEHSRSEYLRALLNQKKTINANDGSLVNPSVNDSDKVSTLTSLDTNYYNANTDSSMVSSGSNAIQDDTGANEQYKDTRNGWQRFWDSVGNFISNINEGIQKYILDPIFDAGAWIYGAISGDTEGAQNAINYDWGAHYMNVMNQLDFGTNLLSGDMFGLDGGDYWSNWADTGNIEASRENINNLHQASFSSEWGEFGEKWQQGTQIFGAILPSIVLGIATGGASAGAQAAILAGEVAVGTISGFGQGVSNALSEGADYYDAGKYGAIEGAITGVTTLIGGKALAGGGAGVKLANKVFSKSGSKLLSTATRIATNAGIQGIAAGMRTAIEPVAKQITYDQEAINKAYGSESAVAQTFARVGQSVLTAAALSTVSQGLVEGGKRLKLGKEGYNMDFLNRYNASSTKAGKISKNVDKMNALTDEMSKAYQNLESGKWTEQQYTDYCSKRLAKFETLQTESKALFESYQQTSYSDKVTAKYGTELNQIKANTAQTITNKMTANNIMPKATATAFIKEALNRGYSFEDIKGGNFNFTSPSGDSTVTQTDNGVLMLSYKGENTTKTVNVPLQIATNGQANIKPETSSQITNALTLVSFSKPNDKELPTLSGNIVIDPKILLDANAKTPNGKNEIVISKDVAKKVTEAYNPEQIKEFFDLVKENKGKNVILDNDRYIIVNTYTDSNGVKQTAVTYVDSKFKNVQDIKIVPTTEVKSNQIAKNSIAMAKVDDSISEVYYAEAEKKYIRAYGDITQEKVISWKKSKDIVEIARKQIFQKIMPKKMGTEYKIRVPKGEFADKIFDAVNTLKPAELTDAIDKIATEISESKIVAVSATGVETEFLAGHKEDMVKAITGLIEAKSELSKIEKIKARTDLTIAKKNEQIMKIRERADQKLEKAYEIFKDVNNKLKKEIRTLKEEKDLTNMITRNRDKVKDLVTGDYDYGNVEERELHTISMLAKPMANLTRNKGRYSIDADGLNAWLDTQTNFIPENYELKGSVDFDWATKTALDEAVELLKQDVNKPELSLETYRAIKNYQDKLLVYERRLKDINYKERKPSAYTASKEIDSYDMNAVQKITNLVTREFGGKAGEIFKMFGWGEITKKCVIALDQASGEKVNFVYNNTQKLVSCLKEGFHNKQVVGKIGGKKITKGELIFAYMSTELAPVNAENVEAGGISIETKKTTEYIYQGEGHLEEIKKEINALMTDDDKQMANDLFAFLNNELQDQYVTWKRDVKHEKDINKVNDYLMMYKVKDYSTPIDKMVKGEPAFRYSKTRTNDKSGLVIRDIVEVLTDYIDGLGTQMYLTPKVHEAYGLLNSKDQNGVAIQRKIKDKYGDNNYKYLTNLVDAWIQKSNNMSSNIITKTMNVVMSGYAVAKLADLVRPIKNYFSYITANPSLSKQVKGYLGRMSKEVRDDVNWYIENHIYNLKYRESDDQFLKGNAPTKFSGVQGKVSNVLMHPVKKVDYAAMVMGLTTIINDVKSSGADLRDPSVIQYVKDSYSIFNLCNVNGDPNHQNMLNENTITKLMFNVLAGAKRAQVASMAIQGALWQQNHHITPEMKAQMDLELANATRNREMAVENRIKADEALQRGYEELLAKREERDRLIDEKASKEEIEAARQDVRDQTEKNKQLKHDAETKAEEEARAYSEEKTQQNKQDSYKHYEYAGGKRIPLNMLLKTVIAGALTTAVSVLMNKLYGKKDFDEYTAEDIIVSLTTNTFLNWIPVVDTIGNSILNGYDIEAPSVSMLSELVSNVSDIYNSIKDGKFNKGLIMGIMDTLEGITGLPLNTLKKYIYGILKMVDPEMAIKFNNLFYTVTPTYSTKAYNEYITKGKTEYATAQLNVIMELYKGNVGSDKINKELVSLSMEGYNAIPKSVPDSYTDENGQVMKLSSNEIAEFTKTYQQSKNDVEKLIDVTEYRSATAEEKSAMVKKLYDAYYSYSIAKVMGTTADSKLANLLVYTNGNIDLAKYVLYLQKVGTISANEKKSKKDLTINYINGLKGLTKQEKLLLMYLSGYSVSGGSQTQLLAYLRSQGMSNKNAKAFLKIS